MRTPCIHIIIIMILEFLFYSHSVAQEPPIEWGKISHEDLESKSFPKDSSAPAVILCDYGIAYFTGDLDLAFERHTRIKILSESGYDWGHVTIPYFSEKNIQKVEDIKGQTFYLSEKGKLKKEKLNKKSILKEKIDRDHSAVRFTLPECRPGCVVEYRYKIISKDPKFLPDWYFQDTIPTQWSEYRMKIPENLEYITIFPGTQQLAIDESKPYQQRIAIKYQPKDRGTGLYTGTSPGKAIFEINGIEYRKAMKELPAIGRLPYVTTIDDYRIKMEIQLSKISFFEATSKWASEVSNLQPELRKTAETSGEIRILTDWHRVARELMNSETFGKQIQKFELIRTQSEKWTAGFSSPEKKIEAICDHLKETLRWNGECQIFTGQRLDKVLREGQGNNTEIALILISMFRDAGLHAKPVLMSTRRNGRIQKKFPTVDAFNHVLVHVNTTHKDFLLDLCDPVRPIYLLPIEALNHEGWLVDEINPRWIRIKPPGKYEHRVTLTAALQEDNSMTATLQSVDREYSALAKRHEMGERDEINFILENFLSNFSEAKMDTFSIRNIAFPEKDLITEIVFSIPNFIQTAGDSIILNPVFIDRYEENPFIAPRRNYPVDFAYPQDISYTLNLKIPPGYIIAKHPDNFIITLPRDSGKFSRSLRIDGDVFQFTSRIEINKARFGVGEYGELQEFYDRIVDAHAEEIVLRKQE